MVSTSNVIYEFFQRDNSSHPICQPPGMLQLLRIEWQVSVAVGAVAVLGFETIPLYLRKSKPGVYR